MLSHRGFVYDSTTGNRKSNWQQDRPIRLNDYIRATRTAWGMRSEVGHVPHLHTHTHAHPRATVGSTQPPYWVLNFVTCHHNNHWSASIFSISETWLQQQGGDSVDVKQTSAGCVLMCFPFLPVRVVMGVGCGGVHCYHLQIVKNTRRSLFCPSNLIFEIVRLSYFKKKKKPKKQRNKQTNQNKNKPKHLPTPLHCHLARPCGSPGKGWCWNTPFAFDTLQWILICIFKNIFAVKRLLLVCLHVFLPLWS